MAIQGTLNKSNLGRQIFYGQCRNTPGSENPAAGFDDFHLPVRDIHMQLYVSEHSLCKGKHLFHIKTIFT